MSIKNDTAKLPFSSDYMEGCHPAIMRMLDETNLEHTPGYGTDAYTASAISKIQAACECPDAEVHFLIGGTQANATVIRCLLGLWQGVIAADTGHIATHEAGAIESGGHKILTLPHSFGKISAEAVEDYVAAFLADANHEHMVAPGMVYISQPTEFGTLYSLKELSAMSEVCRRYGLRLYVDGARLAYALSSPENDVTLADLARLTDVFYIGGTKCGAMFGEAVVIPNKGLIPHFFTLIKQSGALLAKGRLLGVQFDTLFTNGLYEQIGRDAVRQASLIQDTLKALGWPLYFESPTNQVFPILPDETLKKLEELADVSFWEKADADHTVIRIATSWATTEEDVEKLIDTLKTISR